MAKKDNGASAEAAQARADEQARQAKIRAGTTRIEDIFKQNFTDDFFTGREQSYKDFALPELDRQFGDTKKQLTYALARSGTLDSTDRAKREADLQREYDVNKQGVADQALGYSTSTKNSVEEARANLITMLNSTGDVEGATNQALSRASTLSAPMPFNPIGQLFATTTGALATQAAAERAAALSGGAYQPAFNTGLFGNKNAVKVTA
jgi:hypothetical protein